MLRALSILLVACSSAHAPAAGPPVEESTIIGHTAGGATIALALHGDQIATATAAPAASGDYLWPPIIDSHVHLSFWAVGDRLGAAGVEGAVDLGAPERTLGAHAVTEIHVMPAGPILTRPKGYPLDSWGVHGFGVGCADAVCVTATVDRLVDHGARVIKLALDDNGLPAELAPVAVKAAHARHVKVAAHALSDASAMLAATSGVDVLAHTPVDRMRPATIEAWRGRAVISTLAAFGGDDAVANLRDLRAAGVTVLYGTDLGNLRDAGPSADEVAQLRKAGLDDAAITAAMTTTPAAFWGFDFAVEAGHEATFLVLAGDPRRDASVLLAPRQVYLKGKLQDR